MKAFESEKQCLESDAAFYWKPVQLQEHGCDMVAFRSNHDTGILYSLKFTN